MADATAGLLAAIRPAREFIVAGPAAVSPNVEAAIRTAAPNALVPRSTRTHTAAAVACRILGRP